MDWLQPLGVAALAWRSVAAAARHWRPWSALVLAAAVRLSALLLLANFHLPQVVLVGESLVRLLGGETATHHPHHLHALPMLLLKLESPLRALLFPLLHAVASVQFAGAFRRERFTWGQALDGGTWGRVIVVGLLFEAMRSGFQIARHPLGELLAPEGGRLLTLLWLAGFGLTALTLALQLNAIAAIALLREGVGRALERSIRTVIATPWTTGLVVLLPVTALAVYRLRFEPNTRGRLGFEDPQSVVGFLLLDVGVELLCWFALVGGVTRLFLWHTAGRR